MQNPSSAYTRFLHPLLAQYIQKAKNNKISKHTVGSQMIGKGIVVLAIVLTASLFGNYILLQDNQQQNSRMQELVRQVDDLQSQVSQQKIEPVQSEKHVPKTSAEVQSIGDGPHSKSITAVAVRPVLVSDGFFRDVRYQGTTMSIKVDIRDGTGLVLVNTAVPTGVDFQTSAKTAVNVAQQYTGADLSNKDIIFSITAKSNEELQAVDGPSAGMAMTVLLVLEIQGKEVPESVLMTGTIEQNGALGPVGGIFEKAEAAAKHGAKTFIVPKGLAVTYVQECQESREGPFLYKSCKSEARQLSPIMEEMYGMKVVEADNIESVLSHFT